MIKLKRRIFTLILVLSLFWVGSLTLLPQVFSQARSEIVAPIGTTPELTKALLSEIGIDRTYDLYLSNSIDMVIASRSSPDPEFRNWLLGLISQEAGWNSVEAQYAAQLEADFSETELQELFKLAQTPLFKKLIQSEIQAYTNTTGDRQKRFFEFWDSYNNGEFPPPPDAIP